MRISAVACLTPILEIDTDIPSDRRQPFENDGRPLLAEPLLEILLFVNPCLRSIWIEIIWQPRGGKGVFSGWVGGFIDGDTTLKLFFAYIALESVKSVLVQKDVETCVPMGTRCQIRLRF